MNAQDSFLIGIFIVIGSVILVGSLLSSVIKQQKETNRLLKIISGESKPTVENGKVNIKDLKSLNLAKERNEISQEEYLKLLSQFKD